MLCLLQKGPFKSIMKEGDRMPIDTVIRRRRTELGLTQEQVAQRLGVTAPAVNKWERGVTCPDIALLPPLARLLETDVNTLLCFREDLTDQEIVQFQAAAAEIVRRDGFSAGFRLAMGKLKEYPACDRLTYSMAAFLEGALMLSGLDGEEREAAQKQITELYERSAESQDAAIRDGAVFMLASKSIQREDWDRAEALLDRLPERSALDKRQLKANLLIQQGRLAEAVELLETRCLSQAGELQTALMGLLSAVQKEEMAAAEEIAAVYCGVADLLGLWPFGKSAAAMGLAMERREAAAGMAALEKVLAGLLQPWDVGKSPLYRHIAPKFRDQPSPGAKMLPGLLAELERDPQYAFLRADPAFWDLLKRYQAKCPQAAGEKPADAKTAPASSPVR